MDVACTIHRKGGTSDETTLLCRIDTLDEVDYFRHGGILHYVLRQLLEQAEPAGTPTEQLARCWWLAQSEFVDAAAPRTSIARRGTSGLRQWLAGRSLGRSPF